DQLNPREDRRVDADADAKRQHDHRGEHGHLAQRPQRVRDIGDQRAHATSWPFKSNTLSLSPNAVTSPMPSACSARSMTSASGVPFGAFRWSLPLSAPPSRPARKNGTRLWLCAFESPIEEP